MLGLFLLISPISQVYSDSVYSFGVNDNGYLDVASSNYGDDMRLLVEKNENKYYYSLNNSIEAIPLQMGNGNYTIKVLENIKDTRYRVVLKEEVSLKESKDNRCFLSSSQPIYWDKSQRVLDIGGKIIKDEDTDIEKTKKIYNYIIKNIEYDDNKINFLKTNYVPDIDKTLESNKGICYDYAAAFAGLLRSLDIPTKLVKGYKDDLDSYHAWNEVFIDGKWHIIDTTYDAALQKGSKSVKMIKEAIKYKKIKEF
jgi:transglutaminase-like putative cysteine protease